MLGKSHILPPPLVDSQQSKALDLLQVLLCDAFYTPLHAGNYLTSKNILKELHLSESGQLGIYILNL